MLRYWHAIRYQTTGQALGRLRHAASMAVCRLATESGLNEMIGRVCGLRAGDVRPNPDLRYPEAGALSCREYLGGNRFRFLEEEIDFGPEIDWAPRKPLLWQFHLHYCDWLPGLAAEHPEWAARHLDSWIRSNPAGSQPGWHPYPTSLRIVNWVRALALTGADQCPPFIASSISRQAAFLELNLERHLGGNHLIENARGMLAAGLFFQGAAAQRWESRGLRLLLSELRKQVLGDGGHFERSLSYHFRVNLICREAIQILRLNGRGVPYDLLDAEARMSRFTAQVLHQDGNIPLFHDSQLIEEETWKRFQGLQPA